MEIELEEFSVDEQKKRKYIRYPFEPNELVTISFLDQRAMKTGQRIGLGENESFKGVCAVFVGEINFEEGQDVLCECGSLPVAEAKIAWIRKLDDQVSKVGILITE